MPALDRLERILDALNHRLVMLAVPEPDPSDVALAEWFLALRLEERLDAWENWLHLTDEVQVIP